MLELLTDLWQFMRARKKFWLAPIIVVMLLLGGGVRGGEVHGRWPGWSPEQRFEGRDLAVTTDFRDLFGEVLVRHLGLTLAGANQIFPGYDIVSARFPGALA